MNLSSLETRFYYLPFKEPRSHHLTRTAASTTTGAAWLVVGYKAIPAIAAAVSTIALPHLLATGALLSTAGYLSSGRTLSRRMTSYFFSAASGATLATALLVHAVVLPWPFLFVGAAAISLKASIAEREQNLRTTQSEQNLRAIIDACLYQGSFDISDESLLLLGKHALDSTSPSMQELGLKLLLALTPANPQAIERYAQELLDQEKHCDVALELLTSLIDANHVQNIEAVAKNEKNPLALRLRLYTILIKNSAKYDNDALNLVKCTRPQDEKIAEAKAFLLAGLVTKAPPLAGLTPRQRKSLLIAASDAALSITIPYSINSRYKLCKALITENFQEHQGQLRWIAQKEANPIELRLRLYTLLVANASDYNDEALSLAKNANAQGVREVEARDALLTALINKPHPGAFSAGYEAAIETTYNVGSRYKLCKALLNGNPSAYIQKIALIAQNKNNPIELQLRLYTLLTKHTKSYKHEALALANRTNALDTKIKKARDRLLKKLTSADNLCPISI